jgi:ABC-type sugar transport system ATPase subunit
MLALENLSIANGTFRLDGISLQVAAGEYAVLMGRTGCGKTTLLEVIAGLRPQTAGRIVIGGRDVSEEPPACRGVGYVPQDAALFNAMSVADNLAFALRIRRLPDEVIDERVGRMAAQLGISPLLDRSPKSLSGGEKQRVAIGRALIFSPPLLVLDEPLSALDDETRSQMHELLSRVLAHSPTTVLHVTHNLSVAEALADNVYRVADGRLVRQPNSETAS